MNIENTRVRRLSLRNTCYTLRTMNEQIEVGASYDVQFAWQLPDGDYIRAVFEAEVLDIIEAAQKYFVRLVAFRAGRQESADGRYVTHPS